jgi:hypothetical protein
MVILLPAQKFFAGCAAPMVFASTIREISFSIFEIFVLALFALLFRKNVNARRD